MEIILLVILLVAVFIVLRKTDQQKQINKLHGDLTDMRELNYKLTKKNKNLEGELQHQATMKETQHGWEGSNVIILSTPEEVEKFSMSLDGSQLSRLNLKISIDRDKEKMIESLTKMLVYAKPCFKVGNKWI